MLKKLCFASVVLIGLVSTGCRTPYGGNSCAGGCCGGSCGVGAPAGSAYAPAPQTYAPAGQQAYAPVPANQQAMPPAFSSGGGSGSR